jgi:predicted permease
MYIGLPFMIVSGTVNNLKLDAQLLAQLLIVAAISIAYTLFTFFASGILTSSEKDRSARAMMRFSAIFANNGFLGLPLAIAVFGRDSRVFTVLIVLNIINNLLMYTLGAYLISGEKKSISLKKGLLNPVLIAFVVGIALNLLNVKSLIPEVVTYSDHFSSIVTPLSMTTFLIAAFLLNGGE